MEFKKFNKIPRLNSPVVITEKLDGSNSQIIISRDRGELVVGSRNRIIVPGKSTDNFGFAAWCEENRECLLEELGPGRHYGEWWGRGIQRGYGKDDRVFSLFNTHRWTADNKPECCSVVPILKESDIFNTEVIELALKDLKGFGSSAAPGFMKPEGIVIHHKHSNSLFKHTFEKTLGKWLI